MYKPLQIEAPGGGGGLYLEIALKYKIKLRRTVNFFRRRRLAQSILKRKFPSVHKPLKKGL